MLTNKTILIISPQSWSDVFVSKHHYALTLAEQGNKVYFLNPITTEKKTKYKKEKIIISQAFENKNLFFITHSLNFSYKVKFHAISVFHWLMKFHTAKILKKIGTPLDFVWSFDLGNYFPLKLFSASCKIFHPVDEPLNKTAFQAVKGADIIFAVTKEILERYRSSSIPGFVIEHGLSKSFLNIKNESNENLLIKQIRVGLSGNHTRKDIDWPILLKIIEATPLVIFEFWGPYVSNNLEIEDAFNALQRSFIVRLKNLPNVILHGAISTKDLARELNRMDAFLICYDILKDQSKGTNYHKILEYISTGKVIVSNNITAYQNKTELILMDESRIHNDNLPSIFKLVIKNIEQYNSDVLQNYRRGFAANNTYLRQVEKIDEYLINIILGNKINIANTK